jgi:hypothetical protein
MLAINSARVVRRSVLITLSLLLGACPSSEDSIPGDGTANKCEYKAPGTQFASCSSDSDCYSGFCDFTGNPGPYCFVPTHAARDAGHGYSCSSDADCNEVLDPETRASGIVGECRNDSIYEGCLFSCTTGGGGG